MTEISSVESWWLQKNRKSDQKTFRRINTLSLTTSARRPLPHTSLCCLDFDPTKLCFFITYYGVNNRKQTNTAQDLERTLRLLSSESLRKNSEASVVGKGSTWAMNVLSIGKKGGGQNCLQVYPLITKMPGFYVIADTWVKDWWDRSFI